MEKIDVVIERGSDGVYTAVPQHGYKIGFMGCGKTVDAAIADLNNSWREAKAFLPELPEFEYVFKYDTASFLQQYSKYLTLTGLQTITGIDHRQLSRYLTGRSKPTRKTAERIQTGFKNFSANIGQLAFV